MTEQWLESRQGHNVHPAALRDLRAIACDPGVADEAMAAVPVGEKDGSRVFQLRNSRPLVAGTKTRRSLSFLGAA